MVSCVLADHIGGPPFDPPIGPGVEGRFRPALSLGLRRQSLSVAPSLKGLTQLASTLTELIGTGEAMALIGITLMGRKDAIESALSVLGGLDGVQAVEGVPAPAIGFILSPQNQQPSDLYECVVSISVRAASSAEFDRAKAAILALLKAQDVAVSPPRGEIEAEGAGWLRTSD